MKKIIILFICSALSFFTLSCGGGSGSSSHPSGENKGTPSVVKLQPSQFIAQTNSSITLHTRVLDGNGDPVNGVSVIFTNLSQTGVLSNTTDRTDPNGVATVTLKSTTAGFATIQVEVNQGIAEVRDRKTVFFSNFSVAQAAPILILTVDGNGIDDTLFEPGINNDDEVIVTATVYNAFGQRLSGVDVLFGSDSQEATFPLGSFVTTNFNGEAPVLVKVVPSELRSLPTVLNITALADNGAFNMVSLFLNPIVVQTITVTANPAVIESGGTSAIAAQVLTNAGMPAPDGTAVNFTATIGSVDPFSQTTDGIAETQFTAPEVTSDISATITASAGGKSGSKTVNITAPVVPPTALSVQPPSITLTSGSVGGSAGYAIIGGFGPFTISSSHSSVTIDPDTSTTPTTQRSFSATINTPITVDTTVTITVFDTSNNEVATASFVVDLPEPPAP
jgi:hypothetical protein